MLTNRTPVERQGSTPPFAHDPEMGVRVANARHQAARFLAEYRSTVRVVDPLDPFEAIWRELEAIEAALFELADAA